MKICVRLVKIFTEQACPLHARIVVRDFMLVCEMYSISISMEERQNIAQGAYFLVMEIECRVIFKCQCAYLEAI